MAPPNVKIKHLISGYENESLMGRNTCNRPSICRSSSGNSRFPKLDECAHFHYENVELGPIKVVLCDKQTESTKMPSFTSSSANKENEVDKFCFLVLVVSNGRKWMVRRTYNDFIFLDTQLHRCVYDRKYSLLQELPNVTQESLDDENAEGKIRSILMDYLQRFSQLAGSLITCGPVLNWLELDNRGNRLIVTDEVAINTPAVAAAYVIMSYTALAADEISFDVGDMISVIDMPPPDESTWWRGKRGFEVGFFPSECVEVIGDKVPREFKLTSTSTKPVFRKHGKLIAFFRSFLLSRPSRRKLKQSGILKERVFGCDLAEHLLNTGREIPLVLKCCTEFIEQHGVVDGIYRLSGVSSNIQRLRNAFDEDCATNLGDPTITQDIHSVASLLKMYFRELPNPLLTYQLYDKFVSAVQSSEDVRLLRIRDVVRQLPPPHYRTLQYLLNHLARVASYGEQTGMTPKNIAIVWAPNLLRSRDVENGGVGALHVVGVQAVLTEYLIRYCDLIFDEKVPAFPAIDQEGMTLKARPKSLAISTPTKLLSLEEARARALSTHLPLTQQKYIDVGGGPDKLPSQYHTVIDLPVGKQCGSKLKKSPSGWKSFFSRGWHSGSTRDKGGRPSFRSSRKASTGSLPHTSTQMQEKLSSSRDAPYQRKKLRTVKSAESLVHCSKESSPTHTDEPKQVCSRHSSPEASMDSSFSFDINTGLSKSPSLQKHTRSSSHESYFDNSMDMLSDPQPEEEEEEPSLFFYISEQMQKMQQCASPPWQKSRGSSLNSPDSCGSRKHSRDDMESSEYLDTRGDDQTGRKQKLDSSDDFAQAKVQRLSWMEDDSVHYYRKREERAQADNFPHRSSFPVFNQDKEDRSREDSDEKNSNQLNRNSSMSGDTSFWLPRSDQSVFCKLSGNHDDGYKLDPFAFYDCSVDKWPSCMSSSDNETEFGAKTVVERYGNAETVLVEVHATQDSSSESEAVSPTLPISLEFSEIYDTVSRSQNPVEEISAPVTEVHRLEKELSDESLDEEPGVVAMGDLSPVQQSPGFPEFVEDVYSVEKSPCTSEKSELSSEEDVPEKATSAADSIDVNKDTMYENCKEDEPALLVKNAKVPDTTVASSTSPSKTTAPLSPVASVAERRLMKLKLPGDSRQGVALEEVSLERENFKFKTPPSPIYPPLGQKAQDMVGSPSPKKVDSVSSPRRHQAFSFPSPSSPVEEVRKKFELQSSGSPKVKDALPAVSSASTSVPSPPKTSGPSKLSFKQKEMFESPASQTFTECVDFTKRKSDGVKISTDHKSALSKRLSEPIAPRVHLQAGDTKAVDATRDVANTLPSPGQTSESHGSVIKQKSCGPSLFTQLKVRKLQSLKGETAQAPSQNIDPWSDPILDMQEEYYPVLSYPEFTRLNESKTDDSEQESPCDNPDVLHGDSRNVGDGPRESKASPVTDSDPHKDDTDRNIEETSNREKSKDLDDSRMQEEAPSEGMPTCSTATTLPSQDCRESEKTSISKVIDSFESDTIKRERINRIKEERRAQLREKLKTESFRLEAEEKERIQSKFRVRKDHCRHSLDVSAETKSGGESPVEQSSGKKDVKNEQGSSEGSAVKSCGCPLENKCDCHSKASEGQGKEVTVRHRKDSFPTKTSSSTADSQSKSYRRSAAVPGDIKDRVAMFERSKDSKETCRLGPNGKFPQKQVPTSLTPSFVR